MRKRASVCSSRPMPAARPTPDDHFAAALRWALLAQAVLFCAGLRHQSWWGEARERPWQLPLLNGLEALGLVGFVVCATIGWRRAMACAWEVDSRRLLRGTVVLALAAVAVPLLATTDPIDYVVRGRVLALHGANPYIHVASEFADDPFLAFGDRGWKDMPLPYGPVIAHLQAAVAWLAHLLPVPPRVELVAALGLFKLVFAGALVLSAWLLRAVAERIDPGAGDRAFVAIAWSPLLLFECVDNAHNEPLVLLCLSVAVAAAVAQRFATSVFALGIGAMTKVVPVLPGPFALVLALRRRRLGSALLGGGALLPVAALCWWQFFRDERAFSVWSRQAELEGGSFWWAVRELTGADLAGLVTIGRVGIVLWVALACIRLWRCPEPRQLVAATASSLLLLAVFGAGLFGAWYHVWWLPFGLLLGQGALYRIAVASSVLAPLAYLVWAGLRRFDEPSQWCIVTFAVFVPLLAGARRGADERG